MEPSVHLVSVARSNCCIYMIQTMRLRNSRFEQNALTTLTNHQKECFPLGSLEHMLPWLCPPIAESMLELDERCAEELVLPPLPLPERFDLEAMFDTHNVQGVVMSIGCTRKVDACWY